jgi:hypothetical protein
MIVKGTSATTEPLRVSKVVGGGARDGEAGVTQGALAVLVRLIV